MNIVADTHLHVYPCYDAGVAIRNLVVNLGGLCPGAVKAAFLAERSGADWFSGLARADGPPVPGFRVDRCEEDGAVVLRADGGEEVYIFAGRQVVTRERVEILSLVSTAMIEDGLAARDVVERIVAADGVPVLSWAPGKWFFGRRAVVERIIDRFGSRILVGDTSLRPTAWPEPVLMAKAASRGSAIVAGSDPLPFAGEEKYFGTYASVIECDFDKGRPLSSIKAALVSEQCETTRRGKRCGVLDVMRRVMANARAAR